MCSSKLNSSYGIISYFSTAFFTGHYSKSHKSIYPHHFKANGVLHVPSDTVKFQFALPWRKKIVVNADKL